MLTYLLLASSLFGVVLSADILAVFPHTGKSHYDVFEPLVLELATRGHRITVVSFFPLKNRVANLTDVSLVGVSPMFVNALTFDHVPTQPVADFMEITGMGVNSCEDILKSPQVQELVKSNKKFDLLMIEMFNTDCFLSFVDVFDAPFIGVSSSAMFPTHYSRVGGFQNPSYFPNLFFPYGPRMSFAERLTNTVVTVGMQLARVFVYHPTEQAAVRRALGRQVSLQRIAHSASLVMVNSHHSLQSARPQGPALVEVGGLHIRHAKPLTQTLQKYLDDSIDGVIVFSMGSVLQSTSFPAEKRRAFMEAFAELPVRVVMKWENESMPSKPDNVMISEWLPQRDILAHPRVSLFVGHGGLLSTSEAVYCGLPMVLMPMFGDQPNNVAHLVATGAALRLPFDKITKVTVLDALKTALYEPSYRESAKRLSEQFRDRPAAPLDTAVYWTEYVLRHKGARHLRSAAVDMPWYQLWLLDVVVVLLAGLATLLLVLVWLVRRAISLLCTSKPSNSRKKKD